MFKPITLEEIKDRLVFSHDQVFHVVLRFIKGKKVFNESFTFTNKNQVIVMDNHDLCWKPLGTDPQDFDEYLRSLYDNSDFEILGFYEYETE